MLVQKGRVVYSLRFFGHSEWDGEYAPSGPPRREGDLLDFDQERPEKDGPRGRWKITGIEEAPGGKRDTLHLTKSRTFRPPSAPTG